MDKKTRDWSTLLLFRLEMAAQIQALSPSPYSISPYVSLAIICVIDARCHQLNRMGLCEN